MKSVFAILTLAGAIALADTPALRWSGSGQAIAQSRSSACFQNCTNVRRWPAAQCREYCRDRSRR